MRPRSSLASEPALVSRETISDTDAGVTSSSCASLETVAPGWVPDNLNMASRYSSLLSDAAIIFSRQCSGRSSRMRHAPAHSTGYLPQ